MPVESVGDERIVPGVRLSSFAARPQFGVTLIELLLVVLILGIFATTARTSLRPAEQGKLDLASAEVAEVVRFVQSLAIRSGEAYGVRIDAAGGRIRPFRADLSTTPLTPIFDVRNPLSKQPYDVVLPDRTGTRHVQMSFAASHQAACNTTTDLVFVGNSTPLCGEPATVLLSSATITLDIGGAQRAVTVDGETGRTHIP